MKSNIIILTLFLMAFFSVSFAQQRIPGNKSANKIITGHVFNDISKKPVEYANVVLMNRSDTTDITGDVTDTNGFFKIKNLRPGQYKLTVQFMGFARKTIDGVILRRNETEHHIGNIYLKPDVVNMEGVVVEADKVSVAFQIDKKVVHVGSQAVAASGTAVEVLENVPSITVDIEGNVSLRGSENFTVLIDGRPTILEPNEILQQLPASKISDIEIITNPSAKFDPEGVAGILNVITKKNKLEGISGIISSSASSNGSYGGDLLLSYRNHKVAANISADFNNRKFSGSRNMKRQMTMMDGSTFSSHAIGDINFSRMPYSLKAGFEYFPTDRDLFSFSTTFGNRTHSRSSDLIYEEMRSIDNIKTEYFSTDETTRGGNYLGVSLDYQHKFNMEGHEILGQLIFNTRKGEDEDLNYLKDDGIITEGRKSIESGPRQDYRLKIDYTLPINKTDKFEAGLQSRFNIAEEENEVYYYNPASGAYEFQEPYSHLANYDKNIHALYSMYSITRGRLGIQAGVRGEYTDRLVELKADNLSYTIDRIDLFPSAHLSWQQTDKTQFMGSYTRRIQRPRGYYLEPFITWRDAYTVMQGNPKIEPEYIDSYELSFLQYFGNKNMFSLEGYRRITNNKIERVQSVYEDYEDVVLRSVANVGADYTFGLEFMLRMNLAKWWTLNWMGNLYDYRIEGEFDDIVFDNSSFNWNMRLNSDFKLKTGTTLQINSMFNSPSVTAQGEREGVFMVNMAVKQSFLNKKLTATLQARDLLGTAKREFKTDTVNLFAHHRMEPDTPIISLSLRYNFNNYRDADRRGGSGSNGFEMEDEF